MPHLTNTCGEPHKVGVLLKSDVLHYVGRLQGADLEQFLDGLCSAYCHRRRE